MAEAAVPLALLSLEEWARLPEDEPGELVEGRLEEEEVASIPHELAVSWLIGLFRAWFVARGGFVLGSELKLAIPGPSRRGRKADVVVYSAAPRGHDPNDPLTHASPDIVVEVVTPTPRDARRDRVEKKPDYSALGVGQYWIVDPQLRTIEILARDPDGRFVEVLAATTGKHAVPGYDGLELDLDVLWAEVDRWPSE